MKAEMWRVYLEHEEDDCVSLKLPTICQEKEYIVMPDTVQGSLVMLTQETFETFREACMKSPQGLRVARIFLMRALLTEVEEGRLIIPLSVLERASIETKDLWCVKEEGKEVYHWVADPALADVLSRMEKKAQE